MEVRNPYDGALIASVAMADADSIEEALSNAQALFKDRDGWTNLPRRIEIIKTAIDLMQERFEMLAVEAAREGGKPLINSRIEMARCIDSIRICINTLRTENSVPSVTGVNVASIKSIGHDAERADWSRCGG